LPSVWGEIERLGNIQENEIIERTWKGRQQQFHWVNNVIYYYGKKGDSINVHVVICNEKWKKVNAETGEIEIKGLDLAKKLENHVKHYISDTFEVKEFQEVKGVEKVEGENGGGFAAAQKDLFKITTLFGEEFLTEAVLITSGGKRRKLPVPGADKFEHKGVTYCASCDGPVFTDKDVVVIGGGNSAFESASQLMAYCKTVTILNRGEEFRAEPTMVETVLKNENVKALTNANITEVLGDEFVTGIKYTENGEEKELNLSGVFVEIGSVPATDFVQEGLVEKNNYNEIIVNHLTMETSQKGI
jgi:thioredoxin reductase